MGRFLESEKISQQSFRSQSPAFSEPARQQGFYRGAYRACCLPRECALENLSPEIRQSAIAFFHNHDINWHDAQDGKPSNHMCDSQVSCINFLFPFAACLSLLTTPSAL